MTPEGNPWRRRQFDHVRFRNGYLVMAGLLGAAAAAVPSLAAGNPPSSATFKAIDFAWEANGTPGSTQVTIAQGGTVAFSYPTGASAHNADFGTGSQPGSCTQTAGASSGGVPPVPHSPTAPGWSGNCTFNTPGTYTFHCDLHSFMTGTIVVQAPGGTTGTTTAATATSTTGPPPTTNTTSPPPTTSTPTTTTTGSPSPSPPTMPRGGSPLAGATATAISIPAVQRGDKVRGSVKVSQAGAGGTLEVDLFASSRSLGKRGRRLVRVGRVVLVRIAAGTDRFKATLDGLARGTVLRHKLTITVVVIARTAAGAEVSDKRTVVLHR